METIGQKIVTIRKQKGLTQEELADKAGVNLRTIQRIEKDETEPRGHTMQMLCKVLEVNVEDILDYGKKEDKSRLVILHLSVMGGLIFPLGDIILPLIFWTTQKDSVIGMDKQGKNILNFRIVWNVIFWLLTILLMTRALTPMFRGIADHAPAMASAMSSAFGIQIVVQIIVTILIPIIIAICIGRGSTDKLYYPPWIKIIR